MMGRERAARGDGDWAAAGRANRRLQATQMAIVAGLALAVLAVAAVTARGVLVAVDNYRAEQDIQSRTNALRFTLQDQEAALWRHRAQGGTGIPPEIATTVLGVGTEMKSIRDAELSQNASPALREAVGDTLRNIDALIALVLTSGAAPAPGSAADRRFIARLIPLADGLKTSANAWAQANVAEFDAANADVKSATRRLIGLTGAAAIVAVLLGLVTWRLLARNRRDIVAALQASAEQLRTLADTDPLTGLANQRLLHDRLQEAEAGARESDGNLGVVMLDLDHFKTVNDTFGHPVGDVVLVETARRLTATARDGDLVARIGGEEFLMLLPDTDAEGALALAERVRAAMRDRDFPREVGRLTASLGVATLADARDADDMLEQADAALYWAKTHGRDAAFAFDADLMADLSPSSRARQLARADGLAALRALARAIDAKDPATQRHSIRVAEMAVAIAAELGWTPDQTARLREAALVHDVGKIGIPDAVLLKPAELTADERSLMESHARLGAIIVAEVLDDDQVGWVATHHERWDGAGYPAGLAGIAIPEGARILTLADCWDAMTSARDYRAPRSVDDALAECRRCAGAQFWPPAVEALDRLAAAGDLPRRRGARPSAPVARAGAATRNDR